MPRSVAGLVVTVLAVSGFAFAAAGSASASSGGSTSPSISPDLQSVASEVAGVQISIAEIAQNWKEADGAIADSAPGANIAVQSTIDELTASTTADLEALDGLAQTANAAFPDLVAQLKADDASAAIVTASTDLGTAMSAFVTYAGAPGAAALAGFGSQLTASIGEWNSAVKAASETATIGPS